MKADGLNAADMQSPDVAVLESKSPDIVVIESKGAVVADKDSGYWRGQYFKLLKSYETRLGYVVPKSKYDSLYRVHTEMRERFFTRGQDKISLLTDQKSNQ